MASDPNEPGGQATLFLSYARADRARAERLAAALSKAGYTLWWDAMIEGGAQFAASIRTALEQADAVVVLWSQHSLDSDWVRDEAALGRDRHRLVPLTLDGVEPPLGFRQYQAIDLSRWRGQATAKEIAAIGRAIAAVTGNAPPTPAVAAISRRSALGLGAGAAALAAGGGALLAWQRGLFDRDGLADRSIAVLPFRNVGGDPAQAYLADGLTEEVRSALSRHRALRVLASTSSNAAQDEGSNGTAIARKLGVTYLLSGSVQRSGETLRVSANLADGATGFSLWSQTVDRPMADIFAVQSEIARLVAGALSVRIATDDPAPGGTSSVSAYEAFLRGRALFNQARDQASDRAARAHYEIAIAADPQFALAHAGLSRVLMAIAVEHAEAAELRPLYSAAIAEAELAVALAPKLAEGHLALGYARFAGQLDINAARSSYDKAYALGRGNADIVLLFALYGVRARRFAEARAAASRAIALDPLNPRAHRAAGSIAYAARDYAGALAPLARALQLNPQITNAHALRANCLMQLGRTADARREFEAEPQGMMRLTGLAILDHRLGNHAAAQRHYDQLITDVGDSALYQQAEVLAQWGRLDEATATLDRARTVGDSGLIYLATDPMLDPLARDPRFARMIKELGLA